MQPMKNFWASKTNIVAFLSLVIAFLTGMTDIVPDDWDPTILGIVAAIQVVVRLMTSESIDPDTVPSFLNIVVKGLQSIPFIGRLLQ